MKFYLHFGIFYLAFATSQLLFIDASGAIPVGIFHVVSYFFLYLSIGYMMGFPFLLSNKERTARKILFFVLLFNIAFLAGRIVSFEPSVRELFDQYAYWRPVFPEWMRVVTGVYAVLAAGLASFLFIGHGIQNREDVFVVRRSFWLGSGIAILMFASIFAFIAAPSGSFWMVVVATFLVLAGLLVIMRGVFYKKDMARVPVV